MDGENGIAMDPTWNTSVPKFKPEICVLMWSWQGPLGQSVMCCGSVGLSSGQMGDGLEVEDVDSPKSTA